jgi:hypothetical protein
LILHAELPVQRFTVAEAETAGEAWGFNCGPGALCGVLGLLPDVARQHMKGFEQKRYTNPTMMFDALRSLSVAFTVHATPRGGMLPWPKRGLIRIQWGGPWMKEGVPIKARYRQTHWVGSWVTSDGATWIYDINACEWGGWCPLDGWKSDVVPWVLKECVPRNDGTWSMAHVIDVEAQAR